MGSYNMPEIGKNVFSVGAKDWNRRMFDALIPLPQGTSYNSYLVIGQEKNALIDTVRVDFEDELLDKIKQKIDLEKLHYVIMNHAEPDHAGLIPRIMEANNNVILITSAKGAIVAADYYKVPKERIKIVKEGDKIQLGGKTLEFIDAPMLHWPETMFTYLIEDKILFPCDFFGSHTAFGIYDEDSEDLITNAKKYFGEIMMPFRVMGKRAIDKLGNYEISMIAPSHGPIYKNPKTIIEAYKKWTAGETNQKVIVVYATMWNATEKMINAIVETLMDENIQVCLYNLANSDIGDIAKDLVDSKAIIIGAPTVVGSLHPLAVYILHVAKILNPPLKYGIIINSYGWGAGVVNNIVKSLPKGIECLGALEVK